MLEALLILVLLQVKHWYIDFVNQDMDEVNHKGIYLHWTGMKHSVKHGAATSLCMLMVIGWSYIGYILLMGLLDFVLHYHIDWTKMNKGNRDITTNEFWNHLGLDQMAHQLTYLLIVAILVL
jgi:hypothetical protein